MSYDFGKPTLLGGGGKANSPIKQQTTAASAMPTQAPQSTSLGLVGDVAKWVGKSAYLAGRGIVKGLGVPGSILKSVEPYILPKGFESSYVPTKENITENVFNPLETAVTGAPVKGEGFIQKGIEKVGEGLPIAFLLGGAAPIDEILAREAGQYAGAKAVKGLGGGKVAQFAGGIIGGGKGVKSLKTGKNIAKTLSTEGAVEGIKKLPEAYRRNSIKTWAMDRMRDAAEEEKEMRQYIPKHIDAQPAPDLLSAVRNINNKAKNSSVIASELGPQIRKTEAVLWPKRRVITKKEYRELVSKRLQNTLKDKNKILDMFGDAKGADNIKSDLIKMSNMSNKLDLGKMARKTKNIFPDLGSTDIPLNKLLDQREAYGTLMDKINSGKLRYSDKSIGYVKNMYKAISEEIEKRASAFPEWGRPYNLKNEIYEAVKGEGAITKLFAAKPKGISFGKPSTLMGMITKVAKPPLTWTVGRVARHIRMAMQSPTIREEMKRLLEISMGTKLNPAMAWKDKRSRATILNAINKIDDESRRITKEENKAQLDGPMLLN